MGQSRLGAQPPGIEGYEFEEVLGRGGMGVVYRARQPGLRRPVAIKVIRAAGRPGAGEMARFRFEAEAVARLQHPNIVQVFLVGEAEGLPYLVLEYLDGGTLVDRLHDGPWPPRRAAALVETLARAMHHAHRRGILHRDLKPANVLMTAEGTPKIGDFGLARALEGAGEGLDRPEILGTAGYMSPEQAWGPGRLREIGPATDVYALGVILYELLVGQPPFRADSPLDTLRLVCTREPDPPRLHRREVCRDLEAICLKCLEKKPERRYSSAEALAEDLENWLEGRPTVAWPVGRAGRAWMWARRNPLAAVLSGALAVGLAVAIAFGVAAAHHRIEARTSKALAEERRRQAEVAAYFNAIALADREFRAGRLKRAEALLASCLPEPGRPDRRGFEWHLLRRALNSERLRVTGRGVCQALAFTPDGKRLIVAPGWSIDVSDLPASGPRLVESDRDFGGFLGHSPLALSPEGAVAATTGDEEDDIFAPKPGREVFLWQTSPRAAWRHLRGHDGFVFGLAFSPDGRQVASVSNPSLSGEKPATVRVWDVETGRQRASLALARESGATRGEIFTAAVAFSPEGRSLAIATLRSAEGRSIVREVAVWDIGADRPRYPTLLVELGPDPEMASLWWNRGWNKVAFSPDGSLVAVAGLNQSIHLFEAATGQTRLTLAGHAGVVNSLAFFPDGHRLASAGTDRTVRIWDLWAVGRPPVCLHAHDERVDAVVISPDGRLLASAAGGEVKVWDTARGQGYLALEAHSGPANPDVLELLDPHDLGRSSAGADAVAARPDGTLLASGGSDGTVRFWRLPSGEPAGSLPRQEASVRSLAFSPDGVQLAVAAGSRVPVWDVDRRERVLTFDRHRGEVVAVAFRPGGRLVASAGVDRGGGDVWLWDPRSGRMLRPEPFDSFVGQPRIAFRPDGSELFVLAASPRMIGGVFVDLAHSTRSVFAFDLDAGRDFKQVPGLQAHAVAFRPDGGQAAWAVEDGRITITEVRTNAVFTAFPIPGRDLARLVYSPDGSRLVTAGGVADAPEPSLLALWDPRTGREVLSLGGHTDRVTDATFSPDGHLLITAGADGMVRIWDGTPLPEPLRPPRNATLTAPATLPSR